MRIAVAGAGAIGCHVGGMLAAGGHEVTFLGRARLGKEIAAHGLHLTDPEGGAWRVAAGEAVFVTEAAALAGAEVVLVCVKSRDTTEMARALRPHLAPGACVISLQNGIRNPGILRAELPEAQVRGGMVPFNVVALGEGRFHRATSGTIALEAAPAGAAGDLAARLSVPGLSFREEADFTALQWGKLLVNLNNALNALSGLTLREQLMDRGWRRLLAAQMKEALAVLRAAGIRPAKFAAAPPAIVPHLLRLPTPVFRRVAARMMTIDPQARSSMQDDLAAARPTEIDALQGEVLQLARETGVPVPVIAAVTAAIRRAEQEGAGPPGLTPDEIAP